MTVSALQLGGAIEQLARLLLLFFVGGGELGSKLLDRGLAGRLETDDDGVELGVVQLLDRGRRDVQDRVLVLERVNEQRQSQKREYLLQLGAARFKSRANIAGRRESGETSKRASFDTTRVC